uniref:Uncharacterized protein n=1 Tax=Phytophthora ramorum TaxID=164328 RepID=H3GLR7_PHYRM
MTRGVLDMLTVIEYSLIENGMEWVKREIRQRCGAAGIEYSKAKWRGFWDYFQRTWLELYDRRVRRPVRERIQLPAPVDIPADIVDDSDDDEPTAVEMVSDGSTNEEGKANDENEEELFL